MSGQQVLDSLVKALVNLGLSDEEEIPPEAKDFVSKLIFPSKLSSVFVSELIKRPTPETLKIASKVCSLSNFNAKELSYTIIKEEEKMRRKGLSDEFSIAMIGLITLAGLIAGRSLNIIPYNDLISGLGVVGGIAFFIFSIASISTLYDLHRIKKWRRRHQEK